MKYENIMWQSLTSMKKLLKTMKQKEMLNYGWIRGRNNSTSSTTINENYYNDKEMEEMVVPREEVIRYVADSMIKVGASKEDALEIGEHLSMADYRGHFSHGLNRMEMYVNDVENKLTDPRSKPEIIRDFKAVATVDGNNGFGQVVGKFAMNLAIEKAKEYGVGMVTCRGSNHYGIAGYYVNLAIEKNLVGFSCTNTSPLMAPTRSKIPALGTNPISLGASASNDDQFLLDMATTCVALGKIELANRKGDSIPIGWALDENGAPTTNGDEAYKASCLMPLGGEEHNSGYKGYGLALMVEILCGVLGGSNFGINIRKWKGGEGVANLGHCFVAIDPEKFYPGSGDRLCVLLKQIRELPTANGNGENRVMVAGDPERENMRKVDQLGGIRYHVNQIKASINLANRLRVEPMKLIKSK